jgi:NADPH:quinone reductase-like Zn-dependent oxidoreductase
MLAVAHPGQLSSLHWAPISAPGALAEGEVMLRVEAAGLNFRDLMWAQGLLPEETLLPGFAGPGLGIECAGVVEAVGPKAPWRVSRRLGTVALPAAVCLAALSAILASGVAVAGVARILWQQAGAALPILAEPIFAAMRASFDTSAEGDVAAAAGRLERGLVGEALLMG